jgi:hypothetical protein
MKVAGDRLVAIMKVPRVVEMFVGVAVGLVVMRMQAHKSSGSGLK